MRDVRQAKAMATTLRVELKDRGFSISHSEALELVARQFGLDNWNVLAAMIQAAAPSPGPAPVAPTPAAGALPVLPVRDVVVFPGTTLPLYVGRDSSKKAVAAALEADHRLLVVAQKRADDLAPGPEDLHGVGVTAVVQQRLELPDGSVKLMVQALQRVAVTAWRRDGEVLRAETTPTGASPASGEGRELIRQVLERFQAFTNVAPMRLPMVAQAMMRLADAEADGPGAVADALAQHLALPVEVHQGFLELTDGAARLRRLLELMAEDAKAA